MTGITASQPYGAEAGTVTRLKLPAATLKAQKGYYPATWLAPTNIVAGKGKSAFVRNLLFDHMPNNVAWSSPSGGHKCYVDFGTPSEPSCINIGTVDLTLPRGSFMQSGAISGYESFWWDDNFHQIVTQGLQVSFRTDGDVSWSTPDVTCDDFILYFDVQPLV
jgi:hypothetical protein